MSMSSPDIYNNGSYASDLDCTWTIISTENNIINLQFSSFVLEGEDATCPDYVEVRVTPADRH